MTSLRRLRAAALAVPLLLIATACAQPTPGSGDDAGGGTGAGSLAADALVLRVVHVGGFVSAEMLASRLPLVSVYGDGRVVTEGPITLQYPGPALPNLQLQRISTADVEGLVERAVAAGVGAAPAGGYGRPPIADAPDTRFTVLTDDGPKVSEVYALAEARDGGSGLTAEQVSARKRLSGLLASLTDLPGTLGRDAVTAAGPYRATEVVALARPHEPGDGSVPPPPAVAWPGPALPGEPLGGAGPELRCVSVTGDAATRLQDLAAKGNALTPWTSGGKRWSVTLRPLLPDETGCAALRPPA